MSSDADYAAFLDKANQDTGSAQAQESSKTGYGTKSVDTAVPRALQSVDEYYVSDADEPFEPVALQYSKAQISAGESTLCCCYGRKGEGGMDRAVGAYVCVCVLADMGVTDDLKTLLGGDKDVSEASLGPFEKQYKSVVEAVGKAGSNGEVKVFRVELGGTRAEYYVVAVDADEGRVVGLKALCVES